MPWDFTITDEKAYTPMQMNVDAIILDTLKDGGKTGSELMTALFKNQVGDAKSEGQLALAYSSTGAIFRSAVNSLRRRGFIYNSWDAVGHGQAYQPPFRYFRTDKKEAQ